MDIKLKTIIANAQLCADAGETVSVDNKLGEALIAAGDAERVGPAARENTSIDPRQVEVDERAAALRKSQEDAAKKTPDAIKKALDQLSTEADDDWTASGKPAMDRVKELTGAADLTRAELDDLFPEFIRPVVNPTPPAVQAPNPDLAPASSVRSSAP
ncbi:hypothetical protein HKX54_02340 [Sulfitobacter sp. M57]|uniref:hypothetical protein n=1 Tax=unclassified Sulfitobacter TaxID=196795 RepID=UPI0023E31B65|nr:MULTISPECIES: hypothetical protein [unclassified Sulfitobacter]MDF3413282.1 hypothetical protein [Sulfitobacter sp. KE5]MDF3421438.1 hypothetical protein [Sulfitobacter sp. KE43]MDF3431829.1 hypothetical protein [Sulfitobacter sp. KE42]MDF3457469.1 hypothetical protein [Sulfitobacter sp. S74]MDF3461371.1 hypothetical protein [Sulfitobacter sp. Ks18]